MSLTTPLHSKLKSALQSSLSSDAVFGDVAYALKGDGAAVKGTVATTQVLASGDTITIVFANTYDNTGSGINRFLISGDGAINDGFLQQNQLANAILFNASTTSGGTLDGVPIVNNVTQFPTDGLLHTIVLTANATFEFGSVFSKYGTSGFIFAAVTEISTNTVARGVETWKFNTQSLTVINEDGGGDDINLSGVAADDWVTVPL